MRHREQLIIWAKAWRKKLHRNEYNKYPVFGAAAVVEFIDNMLLPKLRNMSHKIGRASCRERV